MLGVVRDGNHTLAAQLHVDAQAIAVAGDEARAQHIVERLRFAAGAVAQVLEDVIERDAGNEDGTNPMVDAAVRDSRFRGAGRERGDARHRHLTAADSRPPSWCQLERVVYEERVGGGGALVADIDLALVLLPGGDCRRGQLCQRSVGGRRGRGAKRNRERHEGGDARGREPFVRFEHQSLTRCEVDHRADDNGDGVGSHRVDRERAAEHRDDRKVSGERHGPIQQVKAHKPAGHVPSRRARPVTPGPVLVPDEIVQHCHLDCNRRRDEAGHATTVRQEGHQAELDADAQETDAIERQPPPREGESSHAL